MPSFPTSRPSLTMNVALFFHAMLIYELSGLPAVPKNWAPSPYYLVIEPEAFHVHKVVLSSPTTALGIPGQVLS